MTKQRDEYDVGNRIIAKQILADPERYGGEESLAVRWARQVLESERKERA